MSRTCKACSHPSRAEIDALLVARSESLRTIADRFELSHQSLLRHRDHIPAALTAAKAAEAVTMADDLLAVIKRHCDRATSLLDLAEQRARAEGADARDLSAASRFLGELRQCIELLARLKGELQGPGTTVAVQVNVGDVRAQVAEAFSVETATPAQLDQLAEEAECALALVAERRAQLGLASVAVVVAEGAAS